MMKSLSRYPDGAAGIALVLLRVACAWIAFLVITRLPFPRLSPNASIVVSAAVALALSLGFGTRIVAFVLAVATNAPPPQAMQNSPKLMMTTSQATSCGLRISKLPV